MAMLLSPEPEHMKLYDDALAEGFAREGARRTAEDFEVAAMVPMVVSDDVEAAAAIPFELINHHRTSGLDRCGAYRGTFVRMGGAVWLFVAFALELVLEDLCVERADQVGERANTALE